MGGLDEETHVIHEEMEAFIRDRKEKIRNLFEAGSSILKTPLHRRPAQVFDNRLAESIDTMRKTPLYGWEQG